MITATTTDAKKNLKNLRNVLKQKPRGSNYTFLFADFLSEQFTAETITAEEFILTVELAFSDLRNGTYTTRGQRITHRAVDRVPTVEVLIRQDIPDIINAVFPADFADEVKRVRVEVNNEMSAMPDNNT